jgi:hypothetical protein
MSKDNTNQIMTAVTIGVAAIIVFALVVFLGGKNEEGHSGFQIVANSGFWYIFEMIIFSAIAGGAVVLGLRKYKDKQDGKVLIPYILGFILFVSIAFGKACTDKSNDGVTSPGGRPGGPAPIDSTRIPAEDLIPLPHIDTLRSNFIIGK